MDTYMYTYRYTCDVYTRACTHTCFICVSVLYIPSEKEQESGLSKGVQRPTQLTWNVLEFPAAKSESSKCPTLRRLSKTHV